MSPDTSLAFAHPEDRAIATAPEGVNDRISVRDLVLGADIGAFQQERDRIQRLRFNVVVEVRAPSGPLDDDVDRILSYDRITEAIHGALGARRLNLLETLADDVAHRILQSPQALRVFVRIEKIDRGPGALGVEIERQRHEAGATGAAGKDRPPKAPRVIALAARDAGRADLATWLDGLMADDRPVVLCPDLPDLPRPDAADDQARRRIALLALEQAAWSLAARDARLTVVSSQTEIDWAMRQGQIVVWAPSKLVLDSPDAPREAEVSPAVLAAWLALRLESAPVADAG